MESIPEDHQLTVSKERHSIADRNDQASRVESEPLKTTQNGQEIPLASGHNTDKPKKRMRKGIYVSYSPEAGFQEKAFVNDLVRQLKENNLAEDIWFDKDENCIDSPTWFSLRMEATERCQAALVILSDDYFSCPVTVYEMRILMERKFNDEDPAEVFLIKFSDIKDANAPGYSSDMLTPSADLTLPSHHKLSVAEKTSVVLGQIMERLDMYAIINLPLASSNELEPKFDGEYKTKVCLWFLMLHSSHLPQISRP